MKPAGHENGAVLFEVLNHFEGIVRHQAVAFAGPGVKRQREIEKSIDFIEMRKPYISRAFVGVECEELLDEKGGAERIIPSIVIPECLYRESIFIGSPPQAGGGPRPGVGGL